MMLFKIINCFSYAGRNQWGPPDRKVDTRKYRAEPRSIFDYEPGKSSILDQEKAVSVLIFFVLLQKKMWRKQYEYMLTLAPK